MIKKFKIIYIFLLIFINSCGYQPILSVKKNIDFSINEINLEGNSKINNQIESSLNQYKNKNYNKIINLKIVSKNYKKLSSKDNKGNPNKYKMIIETEIFIEKDGNLISKRKFLEFLNYDKLKDNFEQQQYEEIIIKNLTKKITDNIINHLISI